MTDIKKLKAALEVRGRALAKERDRLRDLEAEVEELADNTEEAMEHLTNAIDALSRLV